MLVQIICFRLDGWSKGDWEEVGRGMVDRYKAVPGLLAKIWIEDLYEDLVGGIYLFEDEESLDAFNNGELGERIRTHPNYVEPDFRVFEVVESLTAATQPSARIV